MKVTFIGLGIMGSRMAANLLNSETELTVFNRDIRKAKDLEEKGAKVADSLSEAVREADVVITMLSTPQVVREVAQGDEGFIKHMTPGTLWVDSSTVSPKDARENAGYAEANGIRFVEAPVAGTKQPAEKGELVFFVGGSEEDHTAVQGLFDAMGQKSIQMGIAGSGASIKILVNYMLAQSMLAFSEALHLSEQMGMNRQMVHQILSNAPVTAPFIKNVIGRLEEKVEETNFPLQWMSKDLHLIAQTAKELSTEMPLAILGSKIFDEAKEEGFGEQDFSAVYHFINK